MLGGKEGGKSSCIQRNIGGDIAAGKARIFIWPIGRASIPLGQQGEATMPLGRNRRPAGRASTSTGQKGRPVLPMAATPG